MIKRFDARRHGVALAAGVFLALGYAAPAAAFNFGDMMNPGKWFGGNRNYDDYGPYGYDVPPPPPPGYGYGAPGYGYPAPGYGYGVPAYGAPPAGQPYAYAAPAPAAPAKKSTDDSDAKIRKLERRIQELEANAAHPQVQSPPTAYQEQPPYPAQPYQAQQPPYPSQPYPASSGLTFRPTEQQ